MKKSFVLYSDIIHTIELLNDEEAGKLFKVILAYVNGREPDPSGVIKIAFEPIKQQLKRDLKKYERRVEIARENGKSGGRPKNQPQPNKPKSVSKNPKVGVSVNDNDNVSATANATATDIDMPFTSKRFKEVWLNWKAYRKVEHNFRYKSPMSEQTALKKLYNLAKGDEETALLILEQSVANGWQGMFEIKKSQDSPKSSQPSNEYLNKLKDRLQ